MKRFRFPLRSVAVLRAHREMVAREELGAAIRARSEAEARLGACVRLLAELESARSAGRAGRFRPADDVSFFNAYRRECAAEAEGRKRLDAATAEVEKRRAVCVEANREVKAMDRLEASARAAHRLAGHRADQAEFDELAGRRARRNTL